MSGRNSRLGIQNSAGFRISYNFTGSGLIVQRGSAGAESFPAAASYPILGKEAKTAAQKAGLAVSPIPILLVGGDNKPGLGAAISEALADASVNLAFLGANVIGREYAAVVGFESEADAARSAKLIRKAVAPRKK